MNKFKSLFILAFLFSLILIIDGCTTTTELRNKETVSYVDGTYSININSNYENVYKAALETVADTHTHTYLLVSKDFDNTKKVASLEGAFINDDSSFNVNIQSINDKESKVSIKFGVLGNYKQSSILIDKIKTNLNGTKDSLSL